MQPYDVFRVISLVVAWGIPAILILGVVVFIILAPAFTFGGMASKLYERVFARQRKAIRREPGRTVAEILAAAGLPIQWQTTGDKSLAAAVFAKRPMSEIQELLARAELEAIRQEPDPTIGKMLRAAKLPPEEEPPKGKTATAKE